MGWILVLSLISRTLVQALFLPLYSKRGQEVGNITCPLLPIFTVPLTREVEYGVRVTRGAREGGGEKLILVLSCKSHSPHLLTCMGLKPGSTVLSLPKEL